MRMKLDNRFHKLEVAMRQVQADVKGIKNIVGKETQDRLEALEEFATYADNMLTELNHALPDPEYDAKCEAEVADVEASLDRHRERLGLNKPQLKQLDQSIFDGLDEKWRFATVSSVGIPFVYDYKPTGKRHFLSDSSAQLMVSLGKVMRIDEYDYDTSDWQNSLIERDITKELTGSDLALELLKNQRYIIASVSDVSDADAIECGNNKLIHKSSEDIFTDDMGGIYCWAVALNNQGEPLTASEAGL